MVRPGKQEWALISNPLQQALAYKKISPKKISACRSVRVTQNIRNSTDELTALLTLRFLTEHLVRGASAGTRRGSQAITTCPTSVPTELWHQDPLPVREASPDGSAGISGQFTKPRPSSRNPSSSCFRDLNTTPGLFH